jgi:DNA-binding NtrC family response regulator
MDERVVRTSRWTRRAARASDRWIWFSPRPVSLAEAREAVAAGAYDVIEQAEPGSQESLAARLRELDVAEPPLPRAPGLVTESAAARRMIRQVAEVAATAVPVLLVGETGTGKEQMAGLIHRWSGRKGPWLAINCAAIPNELMESELFGHARGAFSGAVASVDGKLLAATGGTVFLDEVDDTPLSTQMKLLRVLEDGEVTRVGETRARATDFRLLAATNRDLLRLAEEGRFGRDLYERLAIVRIDLPPLRDRREDIPDLVRHFVGRFYELHPDRARVESVSARALEALREHGWPGNIRELRNVVFHALIQKRCGGEILLSDLPRLLHSESGTGGAAVDEAAVRRAVGAGQFNLKREREALERAALTAALASSGGSAARAAILLGEVGRGAASQPGATVRAMRRRLGV